MLSGTGMYSKVIVETNGCVAVTREGDFNNTYGEHKECIEKGM